MRKEDFFDESIIAFAKDGHSHISHDHTATPSSLATLVYYEWNKSSNMWVKLRDEDPEPDQSTLPNGKFDGQIVEVEL